MKINRQLSLIFNYILLNLYLNKTLSIRFIKKFYSSPTLSNESYQGIIINIITIGTYLIWLLIKKHQLLKVIL